MFKKLSKFLFVTLAETTFGEVNNWKMAHSKCHVAFNNNQSI